LLRLDYLSCALTIVSTVMVGRRKWQGWVIAGVNSVIICVIGVRTAQTGFIPANLFCLGLYACNIYQWRFGGKRQSATEAVPVRAAEIVQAPAQAIAKEHKRRVALIVTRERACRSGEGIAGTHRVRSAATRSARSAKLK
jgi:hypothetical protein